MNFFRSILVAFGFFQKSVRLIAPCTTTVKNTGSMLPEFTGVETVRITPADFDSLQPGELVVAYWSGKNLNVMHRILSTRGSGRDKVYVTKGSSNLTSDAHYLTRENFVGKVDKVSITLV